MSELSSSKVEVRKYILISKPSRWGQRGQRVVVQSPMLRIPKDVVQVPVKRYHGEEQNSVYFIPKSDIEKDSNSIYARQHVSTESTWIDSHGVVLFDSADLDDFVYMRGDKLWIHSGPQANGQRAKVPVINLNTYKSGTIAIDHVCWFPKVQGPNQELWTLGGEIRKLKLCGPKNYSFWSWVISQKLDGTPSTTKDVSIPVNEIKMEDRRTLSNSEAKSLFEERRQLMLESPDGVASKAKGKTSAELQEKGCVSLTSSQAETPFPLTPPISPPVETNGKSKAVPVAEWQASPPSSATSIATTFPLPPRSLPLGAIDALKRIRDTVTGPSHLYILPNGPIHPQKPPPLRSRPGSTSGTAQTLLPFTIPSISTEPSNREFSSTNRTDILCATPKADMFHDDYEPAINLQDLEVLKNPGNAILSKWAETIVNPMHENPLLAGLCDEGIRSCKYITLSRDKHFHPDPRKCLFSNSRLNSGIGGINGGEVEHEHCISRLSALPGGAGDCLLANKPERGRGHICCFWKEEDLGGVSVQFKRGYEKGKWKEGGRKKMKICDRSSLCEVKVGDLVGRMGFREEELGEAGRWLMEVESGKGVAGTNMDVDDVASPWVDVETSQLTGWVGEKFA